MPELMDFYGAIEELHDLVIKRGYTCCITSRRSGWGVDIRAPGDGVAGDFLRISDNGKAEHENYDWCFSSPDYGGDGTLLDAICRAMRRANPGN